MDWHRRTCSVGVSRSQSDQSETTSRWHVIRDYRTRRKSNGGDVMTRETAGFLFLIVGTVVLYLLMRSSLNNMSKQERGHYQWQFDIYLIIGIIGFVCVWLALFAPSTAFHSVGIGK